MNPQMHTLLVADRQREIAAIAADGYRRHTAEARRADSGRVRVGSRGPSPFGRRHTAPCRCAADCCA